MPVTQMWIRPDPLSSASTASVQLSGWAKGNLRKTCTVVRPLKVPDLLPALVPRVHTIVQLPVMPCLGAAQIPALIETGLLSVAPLGSQRAKSPRELHEPMLRVTVGVFAVLVADADADRAPIERAAIPPAATPRTVVLMLSPNKWSGPGLTDALVSAEGRGDRHIG